jgi:5-methyltetrahydrofolate--homocysteine methyltransferase
LFDDAKSMLNKIVEENWLSARAVFGLYPAKAVNEDIIIYADESRTTELTRWVGLRQQQKQPKGRFNLALADFVGDDTQAPDYIGAFAVTAGHRIEERVAAFEAAHDDYSAIMLKSLADRLAEACAEWLHLQIRTQYWGYTNNEVFTNAELIAEQYKGIRPAPGYPACPDHTAKRELFALLDAPANAGMLLTESCAMLPAAAVSGFYIGHPSAAYFAIPKIARDQLEDWAARKNMSLKDAEYWLAPLL